MMVYFNTTVIELFSQMVYGNVVYFVRVVVEVKVLPYVLTYRRDLSVC